MKKNADIICYMLTSLISLQQGNLKKSEKSVKIVKYSYLLNNLRRISMKFSEKMWLIIILKVTKKTGFITLSLENTFFKKPQEGDSN